MAEFSYECEIPVRFQDLDAVGHVNNAIYATYLEEARIAYMEDVMGVDADESGAVIAHLAIDYRRPVTDDDHVTVALRTEELGESSIPMTYEIRVGETVAATAETVMVITDGEGGTRRVPDAWRERITAHESRDDVTTDI